jgi:mannose-6-phosphate isomerase-like protein (cupin superfamily)
MKKFQFVLATAVFFFFFCVTSSSAQEFMKTDAKIIKVLADTTYMTAMEVTFPPGYKTALHTHAAQFIYALTDGTLSVTHADGKTEEFSLKVGDSMGAPPEGPHMTTNPGKKPVKFILVEMKEHPYKPMMK